jgi:hypothetical protein
VFGWAPTCCSTADRPRRQHRNIIGHPSADHGVI